MSKFSAQDYQQNPGKYELFRTAVIDKTVFTSPGEQLLTEGDFVGIEYAGKARNQLFRRDEPLYRVKGTDRTLYGNCLRDFVL